MSATRNIKTIGVRQAALRKSEQRGSQKNVEEQQEVFQILKMGSAMLWLKYARRTLMVAWVLLACLLVITPLAVAKTLLSRADSSGGLRPKRSLIDSTVSGISGNGRYITFTALSRGRSAAFVRDIKLKRTFSINTYAFRDASNRESFDHGRQKQS
jgi:hypothetical protein